MGPAGGLAVKATTFRRCRRDRRLVWLVFFRNGFDRSRFSRAGCRRSHRSGFLSEQTGESRAFIGCSGASARMRLHRVDQPISARFFPNLFPNRQALVPRAKSIVSRIWFDATQKIFRLAVFGRLPARCSKTRKTKVRMLEIFDMPANR